MLSLHLLLRQQWFILSYCEMSTGSTPGGDSAASFADRESTPPNRQEWRLQVRRKRSSIMKKLVFSLALLIASSAFGGNVTFGEIKARYLEQPVRVAGRVSAESLDDWYVVRRGEDGVPKFSSFSRVPPKYHLAVGKVVAIELDKKPESTVDAFGKELDLSRLKDPYVVVIVRFDDGTEAATRMFEYAMHGDTLQLVSEAERSSLEIKTALAKLDGKSIYLPMYQKAYAPSTPLEQLVQIIPSASPLSFNDVPRATALKILETKYLDGYNRALVRIALPKGETAILVGDTRHFDLKRDYKPSDLDRLGFHGAVSLKGFTPREVSAIKEVGFFPGMSQQALYWSVGLPDKENQYGRNAIQAVFPTGLIVYLKNDRVTNWQRL